MRPGAITEGIRALWWKVRKWLDRVRGAVGELGCSLNGATRLSRINGLSHDPSFDRKAQQALKVVTASAKCFVAPFRELEPMFSLRGVGVTCLFWEQATSVRI